MQLHQSFSRASTGAYAVVIADVAMEMDHPPVAVPERIHSDTSVIDSPSLYTYEVCDESPVPVKISLSEIPPQLPRPSEAILAQQTQILWLGSS